MIVCAPAITAVIVAAGVVEHWKQAVETWQDLPAFMDWSSKGKVGTLHSGTVVQGLW